MSDSDKRLRKQLYEARMAQKIDAMIVERDAAERTAPMVQRRNAIKDLRRIERR